MWALWETTGFVPRSKVIVARSKSMLWKSHPTPAIRRRTTGYEGASTVPEVNLDGEPSLLQEPRAGPVEVRVEVRGRAEVRPDGGRPVVVERLPHLRREIVEQLLP